MHPLCVPTDLTGPKAPTEGGEGEVTVRLWTTINNAEETILLSKCWFFFSLEIQCKQ